MAEIINIPGAVYGMDHISKAVVSGLVANDKLPADFYFRLFAFDDEDCGSWGGSKPSTRSRIARTDILAALQMGEPSTEAATYLYGPLPPWVQIPKRVSPRAAIAGLDTRYYIQQDVIEASSRLSRMPHIARSSWMDYLQLVDTSILPKLHQETHHPADSPGEQRWRHRSALARIAIRDDVMLELYENNGPTMTSAKRELLHYTLLDEHPELGVDL